MARPPASRPHIGTRLRERRLGQGMRQADLARSVGISPAYLNLIEHNKRRIGGKLLNDLARALGVEAASLSAGADSAQAGLLQAAAQRVPEAGAELDRIDEFSGRFAGWAALLARQHQRIRELERLVETLSDRLTHDPHLAASLHEVLTSVTAIRSAVSILTEEGGVDPEWQARFLRNVAEDTARLSEGAGGLARFLETGGDVARGHASPLEELGAFLEHHGFAFAGDEAVGEPDGWQAHLPGAASQDLARDWLTRHHADRQALPEGDLLAAWDASGGDPFRAGARLGQPPDRVMRRLACREGAGDIGLVIADGSGTITTRKTLPGFAVPRFGAACPRWPLFQALTAPGRPVAQQVRLPGVAGARFLCAAIALLRTPEGAGGPPVVEATMLIRPAPGGGDGLEVGSSCRVCPRPGCAARREPSILLPAAS